MKTIEDRNLLAAAVRDFVCDWRTFASIELFVAALGLILITLLSGHCGECTWLVWVACAFVDCGKDSSLRQRAAA